MKHLSALAAPPSLAVALKPPQTGRNSHGQQKCSTERETLSCLRARTGGAWLLCCLIRTTQFPSAVPLPPTCGIFPLSEQGCCSVPRLCQGGSEGRAQTWPLRTRTGPPCPAVPSPVPSRAPAPAEIPGKALPSIAGLSQRPERSCSQGSMPAGKNPIPAV